MDESLPSELQPTPSTHSFLRILFLTLSIVFFVGVILYLLYHNGKSIYDNGL
jgi:hypothetical protein